MSVMLYCCVVLTIRNQMQTVWPGTPCMRSVHYANAADCSTELYFVSWTARHCASTTSVQLDHSTTVYAIYAFGNDEQLINAPFPWMC